MSVVAQVVDGVEVNPPVSGSVAPFGKLSNSAIPVLKGTWAQVAKDFSFFQPLDYVEPSFDSTNSVLKIPDTVLELGRKKYALCLVGQFLGNAPKFGLIHVMANKLWGKHGPVGVSPYKTDLFLFQFPNEASLSRALYSSWHIGGTPLFLHKWDSKVQKLEFTASRLPVWVQLSQVPLELQTREGISYLASTVGKPLHMDQDCSKLLRSRINVCMEIDFSKSLIHDLTVIVNDEPCSIGISYPWKPQ
ncbi:hypothetical protein Tsubulata_009273 [Turnera subulata]|uniref:DUF4283 domain-containing protein n=1 Tax=Turnera subulata TaxID=218843 RepID=A0A9Q0FEK5_9ROSI|nr:hypothetical protein Tsubulata_009273 [Turnera subulata]